MRFFGKISLNELVADDRRTSEDRPRLMLEESRMMKNAKPSVVVDQSQMIGEIIAPLNSYPSEALQIECGELFLKHQIFSLS